MRSQAMNVQRRWRVGRAVAIAMGISCAAWGEEASLVAALSAEKNAVLRQELLRNWESVRAVDYPDGLRAALMDPYPGVVMEAARLAGETRSGTVADLTGALNRNRRRPDGYGISIGMEIVRALGQLGDPAAIPALGGELERNLNWNVDGLIVDALGQIGHADALPLLQKYLAQLPAVEPENPMEKFAWQEIVGRTEQAIEKCGGAP